jgi:hypothetical protein
MLTLSWNASAQQVADSDWKHGTTLSAFAGAGTDSSKTGAVGGMSMGWEATPVLAFEGSGSWLDRGAGADAFAAALKVQAGLRSVRTVVPFVEAGFGLYRAWFDPESTSIPEFYERRMNTTAPATPTPRTFTDPALVFGGGVSLFASRRISLRPDVETMLVRADGQSYFVTTVAVRLAYHFEEHPVTPARRFR